MDCSLELRELAHLLRAGADIAWDVSDHRPDMASNIARLVARAIDMAENLDRLAASQGRGDAHSCGGVKQSDASG